MKETQLTELLLQALEHERCGRNLYSSAIDCAYNIDLKTTWKRYLQETNAHVLALEKVCDILGLNPEHSTPGRRIVSMQAESLLRAIAMAREAGDPAATQIVASECVITAETRDHLNWELIGRCSEKATGAAAKALKEACESVENQEDEHLYHSKGWCRELWISRLGMRAVLPPPEERKQAKTAIGAERAKNARFS